MSKKENNYMNYLVNKSKQDYYRDRAIQKKEDALFPGSKEWLAERAAEKKVAAASKTEQSKGESPPNSKYPHLNSSDIKRLDSRGPSQLAYMPIRSDSPLSAHDKLIDSANYLAESAEKRAATLEHPGAKQGAHDEAKKNERKGHGSQRYKRCKGRKRMG